MGKNIRSSSRPKALAPSIPMPPLADAMDAVHLSVDRFCLLAGVEALAEMMEEDATTVCGARHRRHGDRRGYRWGRTHSEIGYHGGKVKVARPRVRDRAGKEVSLESWQALRDGNLLLEWALNLMVLNVSTRKYHRAVRLPEGDLAKARGDGTSKSAVSRRFVALSRKKMKAWLASDLSELDLLVIQIDGLHVGDHVLMAAIGVDGNGDKHVLAVVEGATENTVVVQALIDNLLARGLDPTLPRLFIVDGAKALSKAIRNTFGVAAAIQRCQVHKGRNIIERAICTRASRRRCQAFACEPGVKKALRQAWDPALACLHQHHRERARHGASTQTRPNGCCATWPGVWSMRNRASRAASWRGVSEEILAPSSASSDLEKENVSSISDLTLDKLLKEARGKLLSPARRRQCVGRRSLKGRIGNLRATCRAVAGQHRSRDPVVGMMKRPAPTSSRTRSARCVRSPATSNAGGTPRWRSDGPPPACWRPRRPSVASRPIASCPYSETLSRST